MTTAAELMERFVEQGVYGEMKRTEKQTDVTKAFIKKKLYEQEGKRFTFDRYELVARFVPKFVYNWDHQGVLDYLTDYILLEVILKYDAYQLDIKRIKKEKGEELLKPYQFPLDYYVKPTMNKKGKELNQNIMENGLISDFNSIEHALHHYYLQNRLKGHFEEQYEVLKANMIDCLELQDKKKLSFEYGSVSRIANKAKYNLYSMLDELGESFMLQYGKVKSTKLEEMAKIGLIDWKEVESFRTLVNNRVDFVVMDLDAEAKMFEGMKANEERLLNQKIR